MALQYEVDTLDGIDEGVQSLYEKNGEKYRLAVEGIDDGAELKEALRKEREERKSAKEKLQEYETAAEQARREAEEARLAAAEKSGDTEALRKSQKEQIESLIKEYDERETGYKSTIEGLTVGQTITKLSSELALQGHSEAIEDSLSKRLRTEFVDGQPKTVVLDKSGKPSAMSVDDLKQEFQNNPAFAPIIVGSKASGAGHRPGESGGAGKKTITRSDFESLPAGKRMAWSKEHGPGSIVND